MNEQQKKSVHAGLRRQVGWLGWGLSTVSEWDESKESSPMGQPLGMLAGVQVDPSSESDNGESSGGRSNKYVWEEDKDEKS